MKLKYYLRGLGIGMVVTALLMGVSSSKEVKAEMPQMIEKEEKAEDTVSVTEESIPTDTADSAAEQPKTEAEMVTDSTQEQTQEAESTQQPETEETMPSVDIAEGAEKTYLLNIVKGDDSGTVARKLQNAGLVENAAEFDAFLMQHGYDKKISIGVVEIPLNATWMEIAQRLSGRTE